MIKYFMTLVILINIIACADIEPINTSEQKDFREKKLDEIIHAGSSCASGCIWSLYAVQQEAQGPSTDCQEGPCACVTINNIYNRCNISESPEHHVIDSVEVAYNIPVMLYYNQYDNQYHPASTCQNTSIAMILSYLEAKIMPDTIYIQWGKDHAQSPSGLNSVYRHYAENTEINTYINAAPDDLISALNNGYIAIVHGYFTSYGHVLVVRGFDGENYHVNDPAGVWNECFKCGYTGRYNGITKYSKSEFEKAVFTSDGIHYLPGWIHLIK